MLTTDVEKPGSFPKDGEVRGLSDCPKKFQEAEMTTGLVGQKSQRAKVN